MSGYVTARLGSARGDWDLVARDAASRRNLATSQSFGSREVVQTWTDAGQRIDFVACRRKGTDRTARLRISVRRRRAAQGPRNRLARPRARRHVEDRGASRRPASTSPRAAGPGFADVLVAGAAQRSLIAQSGLDATTRVADMTAFARQSDAHRRRRAAAAGRSALPSGRQTYRTYEDVQTELKALVEKHPDTVRPVVIGKTFQGRDIEGVEIANNVKADDGRPTFFLMGAAPRARVAVRGGGHGVRDDARRPERATPASPTLRANERTMIVPVVNVDGFISTRQDSAVDPNDNNPAGQDPNVHLGEAVAPPGGILAYRRKNCDGEFPSGSVPVRAAVRHRQQPQLRQPLGRPRLEPGPDLAELPRPRPALGARDPGGVELRAHASGDVPDDAAQRRRARAAPAGPARRRQVARRGPR